MIARLLLALVLTLNATISAALADAPPRFPSYTVVTDDKGVWWFESKGGERFYSLAINNVSPEPFMPKAGTKFYNPVPSEFKGDLSAWASWARELLLSHNFNTLGAWSHGSIPTGNGLRTTPVLYVVEHEGTRCLSPLRPDFEQYVLTNTRAAIAKIPKDADLLGVFLDNEMPWYGKSGWDDIPTYTLLEQAFELPATDIRRVAALDFLKARHADIKAFAAAYEHTVNLWTDVSAEMLKRSTSDIAHADRAAFTEMLANRFYETTTRIVRQELPGVLILGTRIPGNAPDAVIRACGKYCDVMSVNEYRTEPTASERTLTRFWVLGGRPIMHTEYSWRGKENASGNPNTRGAGAVVPTQADRARNYASLVSDIATVPYVIGSHWFEFSDQSPQGRFDGEDSNYGVVNIHNKPYTELLSAMRETNARVHKLHASTTRRMPNELPKAQAITYTPGQHPGRAPQLDLLGEWIHEPEIWGAPDAKVQWKKQDGTLVLTYDAGAQYGGGINIFGPKASALNAGPKHACDLDGYSTIVLDFEAPDGLQLNFVLAEAGAVPPSAATIDKSAGDDGEAFVSRPFYGQGKRGTHRIPIADLKKQPFFGNQAGAWRIDMQAVRNTGLQVSGSPQRGEVKVYRFALER